MTLYYQDEHLTMLHGDCRAVLAELPADSVHCVITSPPYYGLRDYGQDGQLGLEPTPEAYVENMVAVFREVRRVLRSDGTVWLNLGDSYAANGVSGLAVKGETSTLIGSANAAHTAQAKTVPSGLKPKDLVGIPWRVAFALQADGWYLRSDIIWSKPNPMPESVTDRPTKSHEYLFLLAKSARYYFDADAVRERGTSGPSDLAKMADPQTRIGGKHKDLADPLSKANASSRIGQMRAVGSPERNIRSVWTIATAPYPGAHFATFPPKLVEPCIKAGTSERGVCPECGAPWVRVVEREPGQSETATRPKKTAGMASATSTLSMGSGSRGWVDRGPRILGEGWQPSCSHGLDPVPATVLDCFAGSGTTGMVAQSLSRRAVLIDLSEEYMGQALKRIAEGRAEGRGPALDMPVPFADDGLWGEVPA